MVGCLGGGPVLSEGITDTYLGAGTYVIYEDHCIGAAVAYDYRQIGRWSEFRDGRYRGGSVNPWALFVESW